MNVNVALPLASPESGVGLIEAAGGIDETSKLIAIKAIFLSDEYDTDSDSDGIPERCDICPQIADVTQEDGDGDSIGGRL